MSDDYEKEQDRNDEARRAWEVKEALKRKKEREAEQNENDSNSDGGSWDGR